MQRVKKKWEGVFGVSDFGFRQDKNPHHQQYQRQHQEIDEMRRTKETNKHGCAFGDFRKIVFSQQIYSNMTSLFHAIGDFFTDSFKAMPIVGNATNLLFIGLITFFTFYWIREMVKNPEKAKH
jgi:hypothetical protein